MKRYILIFACFIILTVVSCGTPKSTATPAQIETLNTLVNGKQFKIESDWAYPQSTMAMQQVAGLLGPGNSAGNINLMSNSNFLKIQGDSISSYLPYFGERQMNVGYGGSDSTIEFKGLMQDYTTTVNKDNSISIVCDAVSNSETFTVNITLWPSLNSEIFLTSASRNSIRYSGTVEAMKRE
ncbi:MAG: DUF4251 domain-containing protein [Flavobacteriaceae bacterium]